jgi:hypothetical protein
MGEAIMIALAAAALSVVVGGSGFQEAFSRAKHYAHDPKARAYIDATLLPAVMPEMEKAMGVCSKAQPGHDKIEFTLVLSYHDGAPDRILLEKEAPFARCVVDELAKVTFPANPPYADLAEDLEMTTHFPKTV